MTWRIPVPLVIACLGFAHAGPSASQVESCPIDGPVAVALAAKKGYGFRNLDDTTKGGATCRVVKGGEILVVSATASDDGECGFMVFAPPQDKSQRVMRLALKSGSDGSTTFLQRKRKAATGFTLSLPAPKGTTTQYRIMYVEVDPVDGACDADKIGAQL